MSPELEQVVRGGDQLPLGLAGDKPPPQQAVDPARHLRLGEDRLDDHLAPAVESLPFAACEQGADPLGLLALAALVLGRDQYLGACARSFVIASPCQWPP